MLTLYHSPGSFSSRILWLLEELGADYEIAVVRYPNADGTHADPRHRLVRVVGEALGVHDQAAQPVHEHRAAELDTPGDEFRGIAIRHEEKLLCELGIVH